ncbi:dicer-1, putative [Ixodes scapularis]|uniref:Dicer-1, putative n=1 Tax=Ixodes scapularis TaxID=6945 RepID=B7P5Y7_IXOSC|nr:dicer-1, putative [Ixodes scapularis]|eukprot:XP_002408099.1 dicer-1, putative [Ixodes scapularis]
MTPEIFKIILHHAFLPLSRVNLLILDECHRAVKQHTYREIMRCMDVVEQGLCPRVLGLTASVINSKATEAQVEHKMHGLEMAMRSRVLTVSDQASMSSVRSTPDNSKLTGTVKRFEVELFEGAKEANTIVCLGTGTGKTFIAVMLIKEMEKDIRVPFEEGGKRTFFLAPTVPLVAQQQKAIQAHTSLHVGGYIGDMNVDNWDAARWHKEFVNSQVKLLFLPLVAQQQKAIQAHTSLRVGGYIGDMNVDNWDAARWHKEFVNSQVLVMTPEIFKIILHHAFLPLSRVNLLILDECHRAVKQHTYREIMRCMDVVEQGLCPRVLGLTASVINSKATEAQVEHKMHGLEMAMRSRVLTARKLLEKTEERRVAEEVSQCLDWLQKAQSRLSKGCDPGVNFVEHRLLALATPKLKKLLEVLRVFRPTGPEEDSSLCGIVFVKERVVARVLCAWLGRVAEEVAPYAFVRPHFVVGHGGVAGQSTKESGMSFKQQCKVLEQFRRQECNLLVATSVVEEGMDVPKCSLVVRFDFPPDYRSYVQSKGRARARRSLYLMMVSRDDCQLSCSNLQAYHVVESLLMNKCRERKAPLDSEVVLSFAVDEMLPPYMPVKRDGAARITMTSAIGLVNRYCVKLPSDIFTRLQPDYTILPVNREDKEYYVCTVYLPMTSPLKEPIQGQPMETKRYAKMAAALETCKRLHQMGELDDNLLPVKRTLALLEEPEEEAEQPGVPKPGTKKRRRVYSKRVCRLFREAPLAGPSTFRLHVLTTRLERLASDLQNWRKERLVDPEDSPLWFGMLLREDMPLIPSFPIFTRSGEELVTVSRAGSVHLTKEQCERLRHFHRFVCDEVMRVRERPLLAFDPGSAPNCVTLAPVMQGDGTAAIDWPFVNAVLNHEKSAAGERFQFQRHSYEDAVVVPQYHPLNYRHKTYYVKRVRDDLSPESSWTTGTASFAEYLSGAYKAECLRPDYVAPKRDSSCAVPVCTSAQVPDKSVADSVEALIGAYLLVCGPVGALKVMKWMGVRLTQCDLEGGAEGSGVRGFWGFPPPQTALLRHVPHPEEDLAALMELMADTVADVERALGYTFVDRSFLLQAVTHASYYRNRLTDCYQRLEFLGDAVIDYLVTRYLYELPRKFNPGQLTDLRSSLVNNTFFASLVVKYGLHGCFKHCNPSLFSAIGRFVNYQAQAREEEREEGELPDEDREERQEFPDLNAPLDGAEDDTYWKVLERHYCHEEECQEPEEVEVPKALGDLFESLMGAVFLDCGMSLDRVWRIIYRMFGQEIESFSQNVPVPPVKELTERFRDARFGPAELLGNNKVKVQLTVTGKTFSCVAKNKKLAKMALAKKCLRMVKQCGS